MRRLPSGTVTLLFSDIEGSTRLLHELGDRYAEVLAEHRRVLRELSRGTAGSRWTRRETRFSSRSRAPAMRWRLPGRPATRSPAEGYVGADVHRAARIMGAGHGGQVLVSGTTQRLLDSTMQLRNLGKHPLLPDPPFTPSGTRTAPAELSVIH